MPNVEMFLDDREKSVVLGVPPIENERKIINPFYEATELEREGKGKEAERIYLELLSGDFQNVAVMAALGMNYASAEKTGLAHHLLKSAYDRIDELVPSLSRLGITPKSEGEFTVEKFIEIKRSELLNAIGTCYKHENRTVIAREHFEKAQALIPLNADIQNNLGTLYINEGKPEDAMVHLKLALEATPSHPQAHWNMALAHLELGDYVKGWAEYDWGLTANVRQNRNYTAPTEEQLPIWRGEPGARVVAYGEQGIGDEILFASMLPDLMRDCDLVVFECHRKLHKLFANSFPSIDIYPTREDNMVTWPCLPSGKKRYEFTHKIALGSLGRIYRNHLKDFPGTPYLNPTAQSEKAWADRLAALGPGPKIGISWMGGHKKTRVEVRSIALMDLKPILELAHKGGAHLINLQYTPQDDEIKHFTEQTGIPIHHWPEAVYSPVYDDTAGLVANLDLVITVCTSVVHLAGSMGVPTWVMTPSRPAWRYRLDLDTLPWYQNTVLFRQARGSTDWTPVINDVATNLATILPKETNHG